MDDKQRNFNILTQTEKPEIDHKVNKVKPGRDYFNGNFYSLLSLFFYSLFFWRKMIDGTVDDDDVSNVYTESNYTTNIFTAGQVFFLFWTLL